jgi:drug/metabolite transporter (DMT)-like permease
MTTVLTSLRQTLRQAAAGARRLPRPALLAYLGLLVGILSLAFTAIFVRWANAPGPVTSFYRMLIAAVLMAAPFYRRWQAQGGLPRRAVWIALLGGLFFAGDLAFWSTGVVLSGVANPTLLANAAPLWVGLGSALFYGERHGPRFWIGLGLAMAGAALILGLDTLRDASLGLGSAFGLVASLFYGGYFLVTQRGREKLDSLSYFWIAAVSSTAGLLAVILILRQPLWGYPPLTYLNFLGLGVVAQVAGYLAINYALGHLPASTVAPIMLSQPVVTALLAVPLAGEGLSAGEIAGGVAVLAGIYIVNRSQASRPPAPKTGL